MGTFAPPLHRAGNSIRGQLRGPVSGRTAGVEPVRVEEKFHMHVVVLIVSRMCRNIWVRQRGALKLLGSPILIAIHLEGHRHGDDRSLADACVSAKYLIPLQEKSITDTRHPAFSSRVRLVPYLSETTPGRECPCSLLSKWETRRHAPSCWRARQHLA